MNTLCVMRLTPNPDGSGGNQRAWHLLRSLATFGPVDFVLIRPGNQAIEDEGRAALATAASVARSVTSIAVDEWKEAQPLPFAKFLDWRWEEFARIRSWEAPVISRRALQQVAERLPGTSYDLAFGARLPSAVILDQLRSANHIRAKVWVSDYDDVLSSLALSRGAHQGFQGKLVSRIDAAYLRREERRIARSWDAISLSNDDEVPELERRWQCGPIFKVPNVIDRPALPFPEPSGQVRLLFVGNLRFEPNTVGLKLFLEEAWPSIRDTLPNVELDVVGLAPKEKSLEELITASGARLHVNVPDMKPYYEACDIAITPIVFGTGTKIKLLEASAYRRASVSTSVGVAGLGFTKGRDVVIGDSMSEFAAGVVELAGDPGRRASVASCARKRIEDHFGPAVMRATLADMFEAAKARNRDR